MRATHSDRFASWLIGLAAWNRYQEMLTGELKEERALLAASQGERAASHWYRSQVLRSIAPLMWANILRGQWLRTLGAPVFGYIAVAMLVGVSDAVMSQLIRSTPLIYCFISLAVALPAMTAGGYLAACMRPRAAIALAVMAAVMGVVSLAVTGVRAPLWYQFTLILAGPLGAWFGGVMRAARNNRGGSR